MIKVGPYRIIDSKRLIIPKDQESLVTLTDGNITIKFKCIFENDPDAKATASLLCEIVDGHVKVVFKNWKNPLGQCIPDPLVFGNANTSKKEPLSILVASWIIGTTRLIEIQLMANEA